MKKQLLLILSMLCISFLHAQTTYQPSAANLNNREWFNDARFGMFIHW